MSQIQLVPHSSIRPSPLNPRKRIEEEALAELAESIRAEGLLQNLVVRQVGTAKKVAFEIAAGERRWRAIAQLVEAGHLPGDHPVPVTVRELSDLQLLQLATTENLARADMTPLEEARAFLAMVELGSNVETIAAETGFSLATVRRRLELATRVHPVVIEALEQGQINLGQAQAFATASLETQARALGQDRGLFRFPSGAIRNTLRNEAIPASRAKFDLSLYRGTFTQASIFDDSKTPEDTFDDADQFHRLQSAWVDEQAERLRKTWAWVEVSPELYLPWGKYEEGRKRDKASNLGVIISLHPKTGEVRFHERLKKLAAKASTTNRAGSGDAAEPAQLTVRQSDEISRIRTMALQRAMLKADTRVTLAMAITSMLTAHRWGVANVRLNRAFAQAPELQEALDALAAELNVPVAGEIGGWKNEVQTLDALRALLRLDTEALLRVFRVLVAASVHVGQAGEDEAFLFTDEAFLFTEVGAELPTYRDLGVDYLAMNSKARMQVVVAPALLPEAVAAEAAGLTKKALLARVLATGGERLDQVPAELRMPAPKQVAEVGDDAA